MASPSARSLLRFLLVVLVLTGSFVCTYLASIAAERASREVAQQAQVRENVAEVMSTLTDAETGQRGFVLTGDAHYLAPYQVALFRLGAEEGALRRLAEAGQLAPADIDELTRAAQEKVAELETTVRLRRNQGFEAAAALVRSGQGLGLMNRIQAIADRIDRGQEARRAAAAGQARRAGRRRTVAFVLTLVFDLLCFSWAYWRITSQARARSAALAQVAREKELFRTTLASIGDGVIVTDPEGTVTFLNGEAHRLTGWSPTAAVGLPLEKVYPIEDEGRRRPMESPVRRVLREGGVVELGIHTVLRSKAGEATPIVDSAAAIRSAGGPVLGIVLVFRDASQERAHAESLGRLAAIVESSDDAIVGYDFEGRIVSWNHGAERMFGYATAEALGKGIGLILPPGREAEEEHIAEDVRQGRRVVHFQTVRRRKDGSEMDVSITASPIAVAGRPLGISKIIRDISATKRFEAELRRRVDERTAELLEKTAQLEGFVYTVAHDLRAPLRAIYGYAEFLDEDLGATATGRIADYLKKIRGAAQRMDRLIYDLLAYSRVSQVEVSLEAVPLARVVRKALREIATEVERTQAVLEVAPDLPVVRAEPAMLEQALINLLSNAIKFVTPGTRPEVRVWSEARDGIVRLNVRDNGIGIPAEYQSRVFKVFERLKQAQGYPGTGVGLAIVARAVERFGGKVGVESMPGKGSTFWIDLPKGGEARSMSP